MDLIAKKYRVLKTLGHGAMGDVYLVLPPHGDAVALKLLKTEAQNKSAVQQFENEFQTLKKLSHPNIARIYDFGFDEEQKKVYFTSPWLRGTDLFTATNELNFEKCEEYFVEVLRALHYLHQKGVVHCDLKPGNIFIENAHALLIDFGLASYWGDAIVGTPSYLAPEIFRGEPHSVQSDLYALGVIFYNCLTRTQPFSGKSLQEIYDRQRTFTPPSISTINAKVPKYFSDITQTLLSKKKEERYPQAATVIEEISAFSNKKYSVETSDTLLSYLPKATEIIGRSEIKRAIDGAIDSFVNGVDHPPFSVLMLIAEPGSGKSHFLNYLKGSLQLSKISVEEAMLPLAPSDQKLLSKTKVILLDDADHFMNGKIPERPFREFLSFLETRILSQETDRFMLVLTATKAETWDSFSSLFPPEDLFFQQVSIRSYSEKETRQVLESVANQKVPDEFVQEIYRNTNGNPALCHQIIQSLIEGGLLFDETGRWSEDLLSNLARALSKIAPPASLEEKLEAEYSGLDETEKEIVQWLSVAPYGLNKFQLEKLLSIKNVAEPNTIHWNTGALVQTLRSMEAGKIIRLEDGLYILYKSALSTYVRKKIPLIAQRKLHTLFVEKIRPVDPQRLWYHQSLGVDLLLAKTALENLGEFLATQGKKDGALECFQKLTQSYTVAPLEERLKWVLKASEILILLDRFQEVMNLLSLYENEMLNNTVPTHIVFLLWEKKGLALLHLHRMEEALGYFERGYKEAKSKPDEKVLALRFLNNMSQIDVAMGFEERAVSKFLESRSQGQFLSLAELQQITNNDLGHLYFRQKKYEEALHILKTDVEIFKNLPTKEPLARVLYTMAECYRAQGKIAEAIEYYQTCIHWCRQENLFPLLLRAYNGLGNIYLSQDKLDAALQTYQKAIDISIHLKDATTKAALLANLALIHSRQKNYSLAIRRYLLAKQILESKPTRLAYDEELLRYCYQELSKIAREQNDGARALQIQKEKLRLVEEGKLKEDLFVTRFEMVKLFLENRLEEPMKEELAKFDQMNMNQEQKNKIAEVKKSWEELVKLGSDKTIEVKNES